MTIRQRSAGIVVVRQASRGWLYLLLRAYKYWDFPKGLVHPGEDPLETARRETKEETGLEQLHFRWGNAFRETEPYSHSKVARYYVAETVQAEVVLPVSPELGRPEHHEYCWLLYSQARRLLVPRVMAILDWTKDLIEAQGSEDFGARD